MYQLITNYFFNLNYEIMKIIYKKIIVPNLQFNKLLVAFRPMCEYANWRTKSNYKELKEISWELKYGFFT